MKTPQDFRREDIKQIFDKILQEDKIRLEPLSLTVTENRDSNFTNVSFSFDLFDGESKTNYSFSNIEGKGFVDAIFTKCHDVLVKQHASLKNLALVDVIVKPIFSMSHKQTGTDAKTDIFFRLEIKNYGISEFVVRSRSIVHASFEAILSAFQFYMNCEKSFCKLKSFLADAKKRHRGDVEQQIVTQLAQLTTMNSYV